MNIYRDLPPHTFQTTVVSAGLSCLASVALQRGSPKSMAMVGALAAFVHSCTIVILSRLGIHPGSPDIRKLNLPAELTTSLHTLLSVILTDQLMKLVGGPRFNFAITALVMVGMTLVSLRQNENLFKNVTFIAVA